MGLFDAFKKLGTAVIDTALLPVDVARDIVSPDPDMATARRGRKILDELEDAYEETFEDD